MKKRLLAGVLLLVPSGALGFNLDSLLVASVGGRASWETLRSVTSYYAEGTVNLNGQRGRFVMYLALPSNLYVEVDLGAFTIAQAYNGEVAWQRDHNGAISRLAGYEERELVKQVYVQSYAYLFDDRMPGGKEYRGTVSEVGAEHHVVAVYPSNIDTVLLYYDVESGLQTRAVSCLDNVETHTFVSDYRGVSGIMMPFFSRAEASNAPLFSEFLVDTVVLNQPVESPMFDMPSESPPDYHFPGGVDWVMMPFDYDYGHVYVTAVINGAKKARFILDSGASANVFHRPTIGDLVLPAVGSLPAKGIGGFEQVDLVQTDSISIGSLTLYGQVAGEADLGSVGRQASDGTPFGGLLGYDFLSRFPVMVDYAKRVLTIYDPDGFQPPARGEEVPFHLTMQVPTIEAELAGIRGSFLVDMGNAFGLILHHRFVQANNLEAKLGGLKETTRPMGGLGGQIKGKWAYATSFTVGSIRMQSVRVLLSEWDEGVVGSAELAGNMGNLLLDRFRVLFDYRDSRLFIYDGTQP